MKSFKPTEVIARRGYFVLPDNRKLTTGHRLRVGGPMWPRGETVVTVIAATDDADFVEQCRMLGGHGPFMSKARHYYRVKPYHN